MHFDVGKRTASPKMFSKSHLDALVLWYFALGKQINIRVKTNCVHTLHSLRFILHRKSRIIIIKNIANDKT